MERHAAACKACRHVRHRITRASDSFANIRSLSLPDVPWDEGFLRSREECYRRANDPRAERAGAELLEWRANKPEAVAATAR